MDRFSFKERLILRFYGWRRRWRRAPVFSILDALGRTGRLLVCLPDRPEEARQAAEAMPGLIACLRPTNVTVIGTEAAAAACDRLRDACQILAIGATDRGWTGLPRRALTRRVRGEGVDMAIDLNPRLNLLTAVLCLRTRAPVRVCVQSPHRDLFFNVQLAIGREESPDALRSVASSASFDTLYGRLLQSFQRLTGRPASP
jgi:hypothetical protein